MSQSEFDQRISALIKQIATLRAVRSGKLRMRTISVRSYTVPSYTVRAHKRLIAGAA